MDKISGGVIKAALAAEAFSGRTEEIRTLIPAKAKPTKRLLLAGLGPRKEFNEECVRRAAAAAARHVPKSAFGDHRPP